MVVSLGEFGIILSLPLWLQFVIGFRRAADRASCCWPSRSGRSSRAASRARRPAAISPVTIVRVGPGRRDRRRRGRRLRHRRRQPHGAGSSLPVRLRVRRRARHRAADRRRARRASRCARAGQASGTQSTSRQVGSALGIAILGTVLFTSTAAFLTASLDDQGLPAAQRDQVVSSVVDSAGAAITGARGIPRDRRDRRMTPRRPSRRAPVSPPSRPPGS